ncbi:hypothetical protein HCC61_08135 [Streptomyces sp. HNM0575]|uniref:hypothetical protein n=1 Tax=Streptomyces sp. HNM0575 TaxID=2716338 RepID=UPI00145CEF12|nr:hypothetical protein [Streptomyces sp. HNM0575]NLU72640.1 hypothetical protein [Streptomyces sp. HNM0575]
MSTTTLLESGAWVLSAIIAVWLVADLVRTGRKHSEDFLTSTVEDIDELSGEGAGG